MRSIRLAWVVVMALAGVSCSQGDSDNVMASQANALDPAQVDLALGPEIDNAAVNADETVNELEAVEPVNSAEPPGEAPPVRNRAATPSDTSDAPEAAPEDENSVEDSQ